MEHSQVQEQLEFYIKRELASDVFNDIAEHLKTCKSCSQEHDTLQAYFVALENMETTPAPSNFLGQVYKRINTRTRGEKVMEALISLYATPRRWGITGGLAALLIIFVLLIRMNQFEPNRFTFLAFLSPLSDFEPPRESLSTSPIIITERDEAESERALTLQRKLQRQKEKGIVMEEAIVIVEGGSANNNTPEGGEALAMAKAKQKPSPGQQEKSSAPKKQRNASQGAPATESTLMAKAEAPSEVQSEALSDADKKEVQRPANTNMEAPAPLAMARKRAGSRPLKNLSEHYRYKSKNIRAWSNHPTAVYVIASSGLNVIDFTSELKKSKKSSPASGKESTEIAQAQPEGANKFVLKNDERLKILMNASVRKGANLDTLINEAFAQAGVVEINKSQNRRISGKVPKNKFPGFIGDLKNLGSLSSKPFRPAEQEYIPVDIYLKK